MKGRLLVWATLFTFAAGAITWGVLADLRESRAAALLSSVEKAEQTIPYVGTRRMGGAETVTLKIWSRDGVKRVEFVEVSGAPQAAKPFDSAQGKRPPSRKLPFFGGNVPVFLRPGHEQWKKKIKDLGLTVKNYDVEIAGQETLAGRVCDVIEVRSRHPGRPSYRVSADIQNRFPLCYEVLSKGERIFEARFDQIQYHPSFPEGHFAEPPVSPWLRVDREEATPERIGEVAGFPVWRPAWVPAGFELKGSEVLRLRADISEETRNAIRRALPVPLPKLDAPIVHFNYTDGLAALSVVQISASSDLWKLLKNFVPPAKPGPEGTRVPARKFTDRGGTAYLLELEGTVILVASNLSPEEIEKTIRTFERR